MNGEGLSAVMAPLQYQGASNRLCPPLFPGMGAGYSGGYPEGKIQLTIISEGIYHFKTGWSKAARVRRQTPGPCGYDIIYD